MEKSSPMSSGDAWYCAANNGSSGMMMPKPIKSVNTIRKMVPSAALGRFGSGFGFGHSPGYSILGESAELGMVEMPARGKLFHMDSEIKIKMARLAEYLDRHRLDGVFLHHRASFAWITGGKDNHIAGNSPNGVAGILATRGFASLFHQYHRGPAICRGGIGGDGNRSCHLSPGMTRRRHQKKLKELIAGRKIAADPTDGGDCDRFGAGLVPLPGDFDQLRWSLTAEEIQRYREGGQRTSAAIEAACRKISRNMTEHEIAGVLDAEVHSRGLVPVVTLVAADDRVAKFRHPIPTGTRVSRVLHAGHMRFVRRVDLEHDPLRQLCSAFG